MLSRSWKAIRLNAEVGMRKSEVEKKQSARKKRCKVEGRRWKEQRAEFGFQVSGFRCQEKKQAVREQGSDRIDLGMRNGAEKQRVSGLRCTV